MTQPDINAYLAQIRAAGDAQMRPCTLVTSALRGIPPQRVAIAHLFLRPRFLLADPTGCGKTPMAIAAYGYLREKDPRLRMLVVTTKSAQFQWHAAFERFLKGVRVEVLGYTRDKARMGPTTRVSSIAYSNADVWITTLATLASDETVILHHLDHYVLVLDEVHGINNFQTMRKTDGVSFYAAALRASQKARVCWGLSATPLEHGRLDEVFSLMELIRPGTFGEATTDIRQRWSQFRRTYYILKLVKPRWKAKPGKPAPKPFYEVIGTQNLDHLRATMDPFYLRRPKALFDAHLPVLTIRTEDVWLDPRQRKLYEEIWNQKWPGKDGEKMLKIAAMQYAQQALAFPELVGRPHVPSAKWAALKTLLEGELRGEKVVIYSKFAEVVALLSRELTKLHVLHTSVTGTVSAPQREIARQRFQLDPKVTVMLVTDAGGEALDLQAARYVVFYDLPWSHGDFTQVIGRAHRIGSRHSNILAILLGATHSLDESIQKLLSLKETAIRDLIQNTDSLLTNSIQHNQHNTNTINNTNSDTLVQMLEDA